MSESFECGVHGWKRNENMICLLVGLAKALIGTLKRSVSPLCHFCWDTLCRFLERLEVLARSNYW